MARFECRTGVRHVIRADHEPGPFALQRVGIRRHLAILPGSDNPKTDADVIMTAAVIGHAFERLKDGKGCRFDFEPSVSPEDTARDREAHERALFLINQALRDAGATGSATLGETPTWRRGGRITGGTGNLPPGPLRFEPPPPSGMSKQLFELATGAEVEVSHGLGGAVPSSSQPTTRRAVDSLLGYQGRGAYTGFIDGRPDGQTGLMSTFRFRAAGSRETVPAWGVRWLPEDLKKAGGAPIGSGDAERIWGMIGDNALQASLALQGMYFQDADTGRGGTGLTEADVVGYVHGMIQAIYDVEWRRSGNESVTPYEIAVGKKTTKLASCIPCTFFMEATGFPASSTHLGRGESWCVLHPTQQEEQAKDPRGRMSRAQALKGCNDRWAAYCRRILTSGQLAIQRCLTDDHLLSFDALKSVLEVFEERAVTDYFWANLILDACTIHDSECNRIGRTLRRRTPPPADTAGVNHRTNPGQTTAPCPLRSLTVEVVLASGRPDGPPVSVRIGASGAAETRGPQSVALTSGSGKTSFAKLKPGSYSVTVDPPEDQTAKAQHEQRFQPTPARVVTLDRDDVSIMVRLVEWDAIEIMFVGADGKVIPNRTYHFEPPAGTAPPSSSASPTTDSNGIGRHDRLPVGTCVIEVSDQSPWKGHSEEALPRRRT